MSCRLLQSVVVATLTFGTALNAAAYCEGVACICEREGGGACDADDDVVIINDPITLIVVIGAKILESPEKAAEVAKKAWDVTTDVADSIGNGVADGASWVWDKFTGDPPPSPVFPDGSRTIEEYGDRQYVAVSNDYLQTFNDRLETSINDARERADANERVLAQSLPEMVVPNIPTIPESWGVGEWPGCVTSDCGDRTDDGNPDGGPGDDGWDNGGDDNGDDHDDPHADDDGDDESPDEGDQDPDEENNDPGEDEAPEDPAPPVDSGPPGEQCGLGSNADSYNAIHQASTYHQETELQTLAMGDAEYRQPVLDIAHSTIDLATIAERDGYRSMSQDLLNEANGLIDMVNESNRDDWLLYDKAWSFIGGFVQGASGGLLPELEPILGGEQSFAWGQLVGSAAGLWVDSAMIGGGLTGEFVSWVAEIGSLGTASLVALPAAAVSAAAVTCGMAATTLHGNQMMNAMDDIRAAHRGGGGLTNGEARNLAESMGYRKVNDVPFNSQGKAVFKKGNRYITADRDGHNGGVWKVFDSRGNRLGTYNSDLSVRIGD